MDRGLFVEITSKFLFRQNNLPKKICLLNKLLRYIIKMIDVSTFFL